MVIGLYRGAALWILAGGLLGCTNGKPEFSNLGSGLPPVLFSGKTNHTITIVDPNAATLLNIGCDVRAKEIKFRIQGFRDWDIATPFSDGSPIVDSCSTTGVMTFNLKSLNAMAVWNTARTVRFTLQAKAIYTTTESAVSNLHVQFVVPLVTVPGQFRLTQGAGSFSSPNFRVRAHTGVIAGPKASSTGFQVLNQ